MKKYHITGLSKSDLKNYPQAIRKALEEIEKRQLPLRIGSWISGTIGEDGIRLKEGFTPVPDGEYVLDFGDTFRGKSPKEAWQTGKKGFTFLCLLQYLRLVLEYPELLKKKLYLDFAIDELRGEQTWPYRPGLCGDGGCAWLDFCYADDAGECFGSVGCARESGDLAVGNSDTVGDLGFEPILQISKDEQQIIYRGMVYKVSETRKE